MAAGGGWWQMQARLCARLTLHTMRPAATADSRTKLNAWWAKSDIVYGTHAAVLAAADAIANKKGLSDVLPLVDKAVSEADSRSIRYQPAAVQHQ